MTIDRRSFLALGLAGTVTVIPRATAGAPISALGLDAAHFGLNPGSPDDQSRVLQHAIDEAARARAPLAIAPGVYRVGGLKLPPGAQLIGIRRATRLVLGDGQWLVASKHADAITLSGLVFDGMRKALGEHRGLLHIENAGGLKIEDCEIANAGGVAILLRGAEGQVADNFIVETEDAAIHSDDALGLLIARNSITGAGNNGIQVWREQAGDDGTIVSENRIENIDNRSGGSGQYGNAVNVFRADNVMVRGNRFRNCAFSAVRGNAASNLQIQGNGVSDAREVALYAEFGFQGAVIANNIIDGAALGISVTNFNDGGRLAVVQGNLIRNLYPKRPAGTDPEDGAGVGIAVEADTTVSGNVVENAPMAGIALGFGRHMRDVAATGNVVRRSAIGIAVSVSQGAGTALIANNLISDAARGAIVGMDGRKAVTGDLMKGGAERYARLTLSGNRAS